MKQRTHLTLSLFLPVLLYTTPSFSSSPSTDTFIYGGCSQLKYGLGSSYQVNVNSLLTSLLSSSSFINYNNSTFCGQDSSPLYGLYQCRGDVSNPDCYRCVHTAISQIGVLCFGSCGGAIQLQGCFVKYNNASFFGMPDRTMVANKCGPITSGSRTDLLSRRDEVLTELGTRSGSFRVSTIGYVWGMAQCVEDLSSAECADCLSEAIVGVRGGCGASVSGDVYLGKCYERYTASGVYGKAENDSEDKARKRKRVKRVKRVAITIRNVVITIGSLGGVAYLTILFRSFLVKVFIPKNGKDSAKLEPPTANEEDSAKLEPPTDSAKLEPPTACPSPPTSVPVPPVSQIPVGSYPPRMCCPPCYEGHPEHGICMHFGYERGTCNYKFFSEEDPTCSIM